MHHIHILEPRGFSHKAIQELHQVGTVSLQPPVDATPINKSKDLGLEDATILFVRLAYQIDAQLLDSAPKLQFVVSPTTGLDHIDLAYLASRNIQIISLRGERAFLDTIQATSEFTWGLLLSLMRNIPSSHQSLLNGVRDRDQFKGFELHEKSIGIVGFGRIGSKIANYAEAFGMNILAYDNDESIEVEGVTFVDHLETLIEKADILSIHLPLTPQTHQIFDDNLLSKLKTGSFLVNTARGDLLDHEALLRLLNSGQLAGAALDVLPEERVKNSEIIKKLTTYASNNSNLILSPHLGGATFESMEKTELFVTDKVIESINSNLNQPIQQSMVI